MEEELAARQPLPTKKSFQKVDRKRIRFTPPGIKAFSPENFLHSFKAEEIDLSREFGYEKRARLLRLGIDQEEVDKTLSDPYTFLINLAPDACSALIADEKVRLLNGTSFST